MISATHAEILRLLAANTGIHFQGLAQAARSKHLGLSTKTRRHLTTLDAAHNLVRHITSVSAARLVQEISPATSDSEPPSKPPGYFKGGESGAAPYGPSGSPCLLWGGKPGPPPPSPLGSKKVHRETSNPNREVQLLEEETRIAGQAQEQPQQVQVQVQDFRVPCSSSDLGLDIEREVLYSRGDEATANPLGLSSWRLLYDRSAWALIEGDGRRYGPVRLHGVPELHMEGSQVALTSYRIFWIWCSLNRAARREHMLRVQRSPGHTGRVQEAIRRIERTG